MRITRACDYTIRTLVFMAKSPINITFMRTDLAKECNVPDSFLGKILQSLAKSDILISERGKKGGFKLAKEPNNISIYDIVVAVDGPIVVNNCLDENFECSLAMDCNTTFIWHDIQNKLVEELKKYSVQDIINFR